MNTKDFLKIIPLVIVALLIAFQIKNFVERNDAKYIEEKLAEVEPIFLLVNFSLLVTFLFLNGYLSSHLEDFCCSKDS